MKPLFLTTIRSGMLALGLVSGLSAPSVAGPIQPDVPLPTAVGAREIVPVRDGWAGGNDVWMRGRNFSGPRNWNRGNWNGGRNWRHNRGRYYGGGYYGGGYYGRNYGGYDDGAAALLGLGLGFGLGSLYSNGYYNNGYYNNGYYAPRRYYRTASSAHVRWCYNRYRSYRAWDNTFQPYDGPRQQCYSPYS
jgi:BA14K-like protein